MHNLDVWQSQIAEKLLLKDRNYLIAKCGSGKTRIATLYMIQLLNLKNISSVLVVSPLRVISSTWYLELNEKFPNKFVFFDSTNKTTRITSSLDFVVCTKERLGYAKKLDKLRKKYDLVIVDEGSLLKNSGAVFFKTLESYSKSAKYLLMMSGTPYTKDYLDIFSQLKIVDKGRTLGKAKESLSHLSEPVRGMSYVTKAVKGSHIEVANRVKNSMLHVDFDDNDVKTNYIKYNIEINKQMLPHIECLKKYKTVFINGKTLVPASSAVRRLKTYQLENGFIYYGDGSDDRDIFSCYKAEYIKKNIIDVIKRPYIIYYNFVCEEEIMERVFGLTHIFHHDKDSERLWNTKKINSLAINVKSGSHGLNLQYGGADIIWLSYPDSFDQFFQANHRIIRRGQKNVVNIHMPIVTCNYNPTVEMRKITNLQQKYRELKEFLSLVPIYEPEGGT